MSDRGAPLRTVPTPVIDDGAGYRRRPKCALCGEGIRCASCIMVVLSGDENQLLRPAHPKCARDYVLFITSMGLDELAVTPMP